MTTETARQAETVGCAGLGMLGAALAQRLADAGHLNAVWNRTPGRAAGLDTAGVRRAAEPAALMRESTVLVLCVSDSAAVEEVTFGPGGLAEGAGPGKVLVDHSSIGPQETRSLAARLAAETGAHWLDAPVSGGPQGAAAGKLTVLAGGSAEDFDRVRPLLDAYAARRTLTGPVGAGQATKLCNQIIVGATSWALAEATLLAAASDLDSDRLPEYLEGGFADSRLLHVLQPMLKPGDTRRFGSSDHLLKDLDTALRLARSAGCPLPVTANAAELFRTARKWSSPLRNGAIFDFLDGRPEPGPRLENAPPDGAQSDPGQPVAGRPDGT
ncbi:3-hydroxyisobutyrate dehydrogenase [Streptomyces qinglanensis]|uniref:3-hydroxyisobutyrate dehydrogenase n=1 Tax=Streptomyces qinglanensis TaxID=943816 RepID=A0A1H9QPP7_9ACTN|nr:NAD(P)-dependent oxidoreductase [Streptomyces qinglanensis]SER62561.1 3-hydroxyisobutyrate dehydrogenase [Streptomyces qinglanensis]